MRMRGAALALLALLVCAGVVHNSARAQTTVIPDKDVLRVPINLEFELVQHALSGEVSPRARGRSSLPRNLGQVTVGLICGAELHRGEQRWTFSPSLHVELDGTEFQIVSPRGPNMGSATYSMREDGGPPQFHDTSVFDGRVMFIEFNRDAPPRELLLLVTLRGNSRLLLRVSDIREQLKRVMDDCRARYR